MSFQLFQTILFLLEYHFEVNGKLLKKVSKNDVRNIYLVTFPSQKSLALVWSPFFYKYVTLYITCK